MEMVATQVVALKSVGNALVEHFLLQILAVDLLSHQLQAQLQAQLQSHQLQAQLLSHQLQAQLLSHQLQAQLQV